MKASPMINNHYAGELAYFDSFAGLIKCKVLEVLVDNKIKTHVKVKLTQSRKPFKLGEELELHGAVVVPRECIKRSGGFYVIVTDYRWKKSIKLTGIPVYCPEE